MKRLLLCADDFSQSPAISRAVLDLLARGRLTHTSCFTLSPTWKTDARDLRGVIGEREAGLHFNLTHPFGQGAERIGKWISASLCGRIDRGKIAATFDRQWDAFTEHFGAPPAFVDGHQHVHALPVIREVVLERIAELHPGCRVRSLEPPPSLPPALFKRKVLETLARKFPEEIRKAGLRTNVSFAGFRDYGIPAGFRADFRTWLRHAEDGTLIMCHPGLASGDAEDPIRHCREGEYEYLRSGHMAADMEEMGCCVCSESRERFG